MLLFALFACVEEPAVDANNSPTGQGGGPAGGAAGQPNGAAAGGNAGDGTAGGATAAAESQTWPVTGTVDVVTVKDGSAEVPGSFSEVSGEWTIAAVGRMSGVSGTAEVDLASWDSENAVRDERIERTFFQVSKNESASFTVTGVEGVPDGGLAPGGTSETTVLVGTVTLSGATAEARFPVTTTRFDKGFTFVSNEPAVLSIESFGMNDQLAALIKECAHQSVSDEVKVSVDVTVGDINSGAKVGAGAPTEGGAPAPIGVNDREGPPPEPAAGEGAAPGGDLAGGGGPPPQIENGPADGKVGKAEKK